MKSSITIAVLVLLVLSSSQAHAQTQDDDFYKINEIVTSVQGIEEVESSLEEDGLVDDEMAQSRGLESFLSFPSFQQGESNMGIAEIAFKVWDIIKDGAPVVNLQSKNVAALPIDANGDWQRLTGWAKKVRVVKYGVYAKNIYGVKMMDFDYEVRLQFGGGMHGVGQYIALASVKPTQSRVLWGCNLNANVEVASITNIGTEQRPNASVILDVNYKVSTYLISHTRTETYELHGDGFMKENDRVRYSPMPR